MGLSVVLGYIKPIAVTCIALWLCLTLARSVTICHQCRHSHTHTLGALRERGERRAPEDCVCVHTCVHLCQLAEGGGLHILMGWGIVRERRFVFEGNGKIFPMEECECMCLGL